MMRQGLVKALTPQVHTGCTISSLGFPGTLRLETCFMFELSTTKYQECLIRVGFECDWDAE